MFSKISSLFKTQQKQEQKSQILPLSAIRDFVGEYNFLSPKASFLITEGSVSYTSVASYVTAHPEFKLDTALYNGYIKMFDQNPDALPRLLATYPKMIVSELANDAYNTIGLVLMDVREHYRTKRYSILVDPQDLNDKLASMKNHQWFTNHNHPFKVQLDFKLRQEAADAFESIKAKSVPVFKNWN